MKITKITEVTMYTIGDQMFDTHAEAEDHIRTMLGTEKIKGFLDEFVASQLQYDESPFPHDLAAFLSKKVYTTHCLCNMHTCDICHPDWPDTDVPF